MLARSLLVRVLPGADLVLNDLRSGDAWPAGLSWTSPQSASPCLEIKLYRQRKSEDREPRGLPRAGADCRSTPPILAENLL